MKVCFPKRSVNTSPSKVISFLFIVVMERKFEQRVDKKEQQFKAATVGLVTLEDFRKKRINLENGNDDDKEYFSILLC